MTDDLPKLPALEPEEGARDVEAQLRALREKFPAIDMYRTAEPVRAAPGGECGGDCKACGVAQQGEMK